MRHYWLLPLTVLNLCGLSACTSVPRPAPAPYLPTVTVPVQRSVQAYTGHDQISSQDLLEISVYKVPDLSKTVRVDDFGNITLPLVGVVSVAGKTSIEVEQLLALRLSQDYMHNPQVNVLVKEATRSRFSVDGEVAKPGVYPMASSMTFLQAMATAGGTTKLSDNRRAILYRGNQRYLVNLEAIRLGYMPDPLIQADDRIVFVQSNEKVTAETISTLLPALGNLRSY
jgi:polysaccharide export outer membrane protein